MKTKELPFEGIWHVTAREMRIDGEWRRERNFEPHEWTIGFMPNGWYSEVFSPMGERAVCKWTFNTESEVITIRCSLPGELVVKCVFRKTDHGICLYFFDRQPHIPSDSEAIAYHHAYMRYLLIL